MYTPLLHQSVLRSQSTRSVVAAARAAMLVLMVTGTSQAYAQHFDRDAWLLVSAFRPTIDSKVRIDGSLPGSGTQVDLESDLGLPDKKTLPSALFGWRFSQSFRLEVEYLSLKRSGTRTIDRDITWDDTVYPASATLSGSFNTDVYRASVGWSAIRTPTAELGGSLGVHVTRFVALVSGQGSVNGISSPFAAQREDVLVPLPTVGLFGAMSLTPELRLTGRVDFFSLTYGAYQGGLLNTEAALSWHFTPNWSAALGYRFVRYDLDVSKDSLVGAMKYRFNGPSLGVAFAF